MDRRVEDADRVSGPLGRAGRRSPWWAVGPVVAAVCLYLWPLVAIGRRGVEGVGGRPGLSTRTLADLASDPRLRRVVAFTVAETVGSVVVTVGLGVGIAWCLATYSWPGRRLLGSVVVVPFVLPSVVVAGAVATIAGGFDLPPLVLVVAAHVVFNLGVVVRPVSAAFESIGGAVSDAARVSGRSRAAVGVVALRSVAPTIASSALLVGVVSLTSFGVITVLGGGSSINLEVEIWYRTTQLLDIATAAVLAGVQMLVLIGMVALTARARRGDGRAPGRGPSRPTAPCAPVAGGRADHRRGGVRLGGSRRLVGRGVTALGR